MADNTLQSGSSNIATDEIGGVHHQKVKVEYGDSDAATMVSASNPLPVTSAVSSIPAAADTTDAIAAAVQVGKLKSGLIDLAPARAFANVAASTTNSVLVTGTASKVLLVVAVVATPGGTASTVTFNSWNGTTGTAVTAALTPPFQLAFNPAGWFASASGSGLSVTTGAAGSTTGILVVYALV